MELSKNDSKMLQGLSVLAMVWLHLFDRGYAGLFTPVLFFQGTAVSYYIAQLCDFCVFGFAFLSGYAHYLQSDCAGYWRRRIKGLVSLLCTYWVILIIFSAISIMVGQGDKMPGNGWAFVLNALTLSNSYNGAWWYLFTYAVLVILMPITMRFVKSCNPILVLGVSFAIYCIAYYVRFKSGLSGRLFAKVGPFGTTFFEYVIGALAVKYQVFTKLHALWRKLAVQLQWLVGVFLLAIMLYAHTRLVPSVFIAPFTGFVIITLFQFWQKPKFIEKAFLFVGHHSTCIWLTHFFFFSRIFVNLVYIAKYPPLIFALILVLTIACSYVVKFAEKPLQRQIARL